MTLAHATARGEGKSQGNFCPPTLTSTGKPEWLPDPPNALWRKMPSALWVGNTLRVGAGPTWLPQLCRPPVPIKHESLAAAAPERVELVALEYDILRTSLRRLGRLMHPDRDPDLARKQAKRDLDAGREVLHSDGVLPWAAYPRGVLVAGWRQDARFCAAVTEWREAKFTPIPSELQRVERLQTLEREVALSLQQQGT